MYPKRFNKAIRHRGKKGKAYDGELGLLVLVLHRSLSLLWNVLEWAALRCHNESDTDWGETIKRTYHVTRRVVSIWPNNAQMSDFRGGSVIFGMGSRLQC